MEDKGKNLQVAKKDNSDLQMKEPYGEVDSDGKVKIRSDWKAAVSKKELTGILNSLGEKCAVYNRMNPRHS